ncbi:glycosyltransferase family 39 protein [Pseudomarimonas salicorniae]|uniref:Glycosyltransferase family 39 protein n=1 Tax=Pseudomarimonas salicorniae TaxID=2933270 RepID=A0ABT0GL37_9GAMM|nr:glycosyltransferase family 39 protein [Lysobacter sp. CAU 1642]MCK7594762.1 glycosyltransferase family 39 protein [Lysobacter sp. CAU 1642]
MRSPLSFLAEAIAQRPLRLVVAVCAWHLLFWVLAPALGYRMLPLDTLELLGWGQEWQLGYYKHPPLGPWLGEGFLFLAGGRLDSLYLLAQLGMLVTFVYVYATARLWLDPLRAALAVALLEGSYFHTYLTPNFNMNSLQLPLWAALGYHFLRALREGGTGHWLLFGALAALCLLSKYSGLLLLAACLAAFLLDARGRAQLRRPGPWLAVVACLLLLGPHLAWLGEYWRLPWNYLRGFGSAGAGLSAHLFEPLRFALGALAGLLFCAILWLPLRLASRPAPPPADRWLLAALLFGPLLLSTLYGLATGSRLKSTWAFPFFSLIGVWAMLRIPPETARRRLPAFLLVLAGVLALTCSMHLLYKTRWGDSKTRFDGAMLAAQAERYWTAHANGPLRIVIGDHIDTAIVSSYAGSRPSMLIEGDFTLSPWLRPADVEASGALYVCRLGSVCPSSWEARLGARHEREIEGERFVFGIVRPGPPPD